MPSDLVLNLVIASIGIALIESQLVFFCRMLMQRPPGWYRNQMTFFLFFLSFFFSFNKLILPWSLLPVLWFQRTGTIGNRH